MKVKARTSWILLSSAVACGVILVAAFLARQSGVLEQQALATLSELERAVIEGNAELLAQIVLPPATVRGRSRVEGDRLLLEILSGEVTAEGVELLRRRGQWGPLLDVFPEEAEKWTDPVGIDPALCVAFRLDGSESRAEVVMVNQEDRMRVLRCNDVR